MLKTTEFSMEQNKKFEWNEEVSLNIPNIDDDHRELLKIVEDITEAINSNDKTQVAGLWKKLIKQTERHFENEEEYMEALRYPKLGRHKERHDELLDVGKSLLTLFEQDRIQSTSSVSLFLKNWLVEHISTDDKELSKYVKENKNKIF